MAEIERMDKEGAPLAMERLMLFWDKKHVGDNEWHGWYFSRGALVHKKMRWRPENLLNARREAERIGQLEAEIYKLYSLSGLIKITKEIILRKLENKKINLINSKKAYW